MKQLAVAGTVALVALTIAFEAWVRPVVAQEAPPPAIQLPAVKETDSERFTTSGTCAQCHSQSEGAQAMRDSKGKGIAPYDLWQSTMMANAARDPLWRAVVSMEVAATPSLAKQIQAKCLRCHSPMASVEARALKIDLSLKDLYGDTPEAQLALDGVSCTVCHQIQPKNLGKPESYGGHYEIAKGHVIFGPHKDPVAMPMVRHSGFTPQHGTHMVESALCATCHTLFTDAVDAQGKPTGHRLPEQTPYLEWRNSLMSTEAKPKNPMGRSCQSCHMPTGEGRTPLKTMIARAPHGGDFQLDARSPFGRHILVGGNTLIPAILRDNAQELRPRASKAAFNATIAAARHQLRSSVARLSLEARRQDRKLTASVKITTFVGHKFPTGHPSRRAWLRLQVLDAKGRVLFVSGAHDARARLVDGAGKLLAAEKPGGPSHPHRQVIRGDSEVAVYESQMADAAGKPTYLLMRGATYLKDNRFLPMGWKADHPDAKHTAPQGVKGDSDFRAGGDTVVYEVTLPEGTPSNVVVKAELLYQVLGARYAAELFTFDTPEIRAFRRYYAKADKSPVLVAESKKTLP
jgi:hypothetical protein